MDDISRIQEVFAQAQRAVANQDWLGLFQRLEPGSVATIAKNSLVWWFLAPDSARTSASKEFPHLEALRATYLALSQEMLQSAERLLKLPLQEQGVASLQHRDLVKRCDVFLVSAAKDGSSELAAALESARRSEGQGGSLSSSLFQDERLENVVVEGKKAHGTRLYPRGQQESLRFVLRKDGWKIRLL